MAQYTWYKKDYISRNKNIQIKVCHSYCLKRNRTCDYPSLLNIMQCSSYKFNQTKFPSNSLFTYNLHLHTYQRAIYKNISIESNNLLKFGLQQATQLLPTCRHLAVSCHFILYGLFEFLKKKKPVLIEILLSLHVILCKSINLTKMSRSHSY